jgi:hypothetical protein
LFFSSQIEHDEARPCLHWTLWPASNHQHVVSYGTHHHGVSGVFVFKNIMVPTITEWVGYLFSKNIMVPTIMEWVGYLFSKILSYPRLWSEWGISEGKNGGWTH